MLSSCQAIPRPGWLPQGRACSPQQQTDLHMWLFPNKTSSQVTCGDTPEFKTYYWMWHPTSEIESNFYTHKEESLNLIWHWVYCSFRDSASLQAAHHYSKAYCPDFQWSETELNPDYKPQALKNWTQSSPDTETIHAHSSPLPTHRAIQFIYSFQHPYLASANSKPLPFLWRQKETTVTMQIDAAIRDHSKHTLIFQACQLCQGFQTEPTPSHPAAQPQPTGLHKFDMK